jgi:anti-sigma B factor antagonist
VIELQTEIGQDAAVLGVEGRLTMATAAGLRAVVAQAIEAGRPRLVLDMGECSFLDSSGLGAVVGGLKAARQAGGDLRLARLTPQVLTVLELTNLDRVLRPYPTVEAALGDG